MLNDLKFLRAIALLMGVFHAFIAGSSLAYFMMTQEPIALIAVITSGAMAWAIHTTLKETDE